MKKRIVVTGAGGFVGANLVRRLITDGYEVHAFVRRGGSLWRLEDVKKKLVIHEGILDDAPVLQKRLTRISPYGICHLATYGSYPKQQNHGDLIHRNITVLFNLLDVLRTLPYTHFLVAGSSSEYGKKDVAMRESDILEPNNLYAAMKAAQTHLVQVYARETGRNATILRLFSVYGYFEEEGRLVRNVIEAALKNRDIKLATGREARDFVYAEDVADAFAHALKGKPFQGEVFNIGTGRQTTIRELALLVKKLAGSTSRILPNSYPGRPWDAYHWQADMRKTRHVFGWKPSTTLSGGLRKTILWYRERQ